MKIIFKSISKIVNRIFNRNKKTKPEINKREISYNNFGFPIYRDRRKK